MVSTGNGQGAECNLTHSLHCMTPDGCKVETHISLQVSTSRKGLLSDKSSPRDFPNGNLALPLSGFRQKLSTTHGLKKRLNNVLLRQIDWPSLTRTCKVWIKKPLNMALLVWITCVAISGAILFLVMTGMLNRMLPKKSQRDMWFEVNNQIINALFTLMCLYQHPKRFHHLVLLCRWKPKDISRLRKIYSKNGTQKPNERAHIMIVIILLHLNCFAQYALCSLNLGYKRSNRPFIGVGICLSVAIGAAAVAGFYSILSPLGKDYECDPDEEKSLEKIYSFAPRVDHGVIDSTPEWRGGLFDLWEDYSVSYLSIFCCFCVFGWNMERLGFGNMYVHIATFILFCTAPFWIFNLAAVNIDNDSVREILGITGLALCVLGLLYGGFWRIQMRRRFNLPSNNLCFGKPDVMDCVQWLFCCWCSLAQEVRTGDFYDIIEDRVYMMQPFLESNGHNPLTPLPRESSSSFSMNPSSPYGYKPSIFMDEIMTPPNPSAIRMEIENLREI